MASVGNDSDRNIECVSNRPYVGRIALPIMFANMNFANCWGRVVQWDPVRLPECISAFSDVQELDEAQALEGGWSLGYHSGRYGKVKAKVEELLYLQDTLKDVYGNSPFPHSKALLIAITSCCYSIRESLSKLSSTNKCARATKEQEEWWKAKAAEIGRKGELLAYFNELNRSDKHSHDSFNALLRPVGVYSSNKRRRRFIATGSEYLATADGETYLGSEGFFDRVGSGKSNLRRIVGDKAVLEGSYEIDQAEWTIELIGLPDKHLGMPIAQRSLVGVVAIVANYYADLVVEAELRFG